MPAASCKNNRGSWVSRPTAPCCSVRIRFISTVYFQILTNYFSRKPFTMKVIQNAGGIAIPERTSPTRPKQAPNLYFLTSLRYHARAASDAALWLFGVSLCQQGHYPYGSAASSAISRLVRSTTYAVRGRRLQIPARRRFDCSVSHCCLSRGIRAVNRPLPRRCRTLFSLRERPWHTRRPYLGKHRPAPIRQKIR